MKPKILISACLIGQKVRFDGNDNDQFSSQLQQLDAKGQVIAFCPEMAGGLGVPRKPCEILSTDPWKVVDNDGVDCTKAFRKGAKRAVELVQSHNIKVAILKERSPSCASNQRYDGTFSGIEIDGIGMTCYYLRRAGVVVYNESEIELAFKYFES